MFSARLCTCTFLNPAILKRFQTQTDAIIDNYIIWNILPIVENISTKHGHSLHNCKQLSIVKVVRTSWSFLTQTSTNRCSTSAFALCLTSLCLTHAHPKNNHFPMTVFTCYHMSPSLHTPAMSVTLSTHTRLHKPVLRLHTCGSVWGREGVVCAHCNVINQLRVLIT